MLRYGALRILTLRYASFPSCVRKLKGQNTNMGSHSRTKGKVGERECAAELAKHWNCTDARRSVQYCGAVAGDADLKNTGNLHVEVKRYCRVAVTDWLVQSEHDASKAQGQVPVVVFRQDGENNWICMMRVSDAPQFARELLNLIGEK